MDRDELKKSLTYLVNKYVENSTKKKSLLQELNSSGFSGTKGILHEINQSRIPFDKKDSDLVKDIVFYYV